MHDFLFNNLDMLLKSGCKPTLATVNIENIRFRDVKTAVKEFI